MPVSCDLLIVGTGAAGLFAATWAGRTAQAAGRSLRIVGVDGARKLGAKILVAGGGRCNVTHWQVTESDFSGSTSPAIRNVLGRFGVEQTQAFFSEAGVALKQEENGKLFPVSNSARTVLEALVRESNRVGVELVHPARIMDLSQTAAGWCATTDSGEILATRVILCTGGKSLPKSGSDGGGFALAERLGHSLTAPIVPALVPLILPQGHWITEFSGLTLPAEIRLTTQHGKRLAAFTNSTLCTHFGLSGPSILDISRHWLLQRNGDPSVRLWINWLPRESADSLDALLLAAQGRGALGVLRDHVADRLAKRLCEIAEAPTAGDLPREARRRLVAAATATPLPITGDRGFTLAEATAGGVPLAEVRLDTMESRICPGLYFAGEILDVDGRIGGFNFQWAWASGFVAGTAAATAVLQAAGSNDGTHPATTGQTQQKS